MAYQGLRIRGDQEIVTTEHDHYSHHESIRYAAARSGCGVRYISVFDTPATARAEQMVSRVARAITPRTRAVGATSVQSSTGIKTPISGIAEVVDRANRGRAAADRCLLIVDGVHGFANQDVDIARLGADFFASGTHKWLFAPRGTGFLWGRSEVWPELRPTIPSFDFETIGTTFGRLGRPAGIAAHASWVRLAGRLRRLRARAGDSGRRAAPSHDRARAQIAARIAELNAAFREGAARIPGVTLRRPRDPAVAGPISCFEVRGLTPGQVVGRLADKKIRTTTSPYKVSYARVCAGIVNMPEEVELVLREIRALAA